LLGASLLLALAACGGETQNNNSNAAAPAANANVKTGVKPEPDAEVAVIEMENPAYGRVVIELYPNIAPRMVERFKTLARQGFYNGTTFHRVEPPAVTNPGGVIQGGDPNSKDDDYTNDGGGQSNLLDLQPEYSDIPFEAGTVGAADAGPGTANSQFFISLGRNPRWDRNYTAFGRAIRGMNDAQIIAGAPTRPGTTNPEPKVVIKSITLQPRASFQ
jgi:cyclophilin family peptidyl-prolyl cis-trans isomerase